VSAKLVVPKRSFDRMPAIVGVKNVSGSVEAQLDIGGTPIEPSVAIVAHARGVRSGIMPIAQATDTDVGARYDGRAADLLVKTRMQGRDVLEVASHVDARMQDLLEGPPGKEPAWIASSRVNLTSFPLETVGALADRQVRGRVSGEATLTGLHQDAKLAAHVVFDGLSVGRVRYEKARIDVDTTDGTLNAKARFEQQDGWADLTATTGLAWGAAVAPSLRDDHPIDARFVAKSFRAAAIQPFVEGTLNGLDGRIDADARAAISPAKKDARLEGRIALREGKVQLAAMGEELRGVRADVRLNPNGTILVEDLYARGATGEVSGDAKIELAGMRLARATANMRIPEKRAFDVAVNGQPLGEVFGEVKLDAQTSEDGKRTAVVVDVPKFSVTLPQNTKTGVQGLGENEKIRVGVYRDRDTLVKLPLDREDFMKHDEATQKAEAVADGSRLVVDVKLGHVDVARGNMLRATVTGNPKITIAGGETRITGQVRVEKGWVDVQGKKFEIERGTVTFNGEPEPNPIVVATAEWTAADDSHIYADFVGPVKTGKVTLRSEPPRPKNEILAMILFGTADGANPSPPPAGKQPNGTQKAALGIGGGFAAQGLTEALDDLAGIQATARIDTTTSNNPRPEVEFQVSPKVSVEFTHVIGTPPVTEPPDKNLGTVEWRFHKNWSAEVTVGDRGRQLLDLIWQRRY
jgi:translocation and assembly module TamB